ncbi:MAG: YqgE/AlgH family protein [Neomegalonema sp.]|nr:YqgE/AlgH family protein [Neomegalonema sp.]
MTENSKPPSGDSLVGRMIIAMPNIGDPRFERTVIYLFAHQLDGAMGLIVNRPTDDLHFSDLLDQLELEANEDTNETQIRFGGPVEVGRGFVLHSADYHRADETLRVDDQMSMTTTVDILKAMADGGGPQKALLALGYAGWGPGQLEREILENGWLHCEVDQEIVFDDDDETKWARALAKIGVNPSALSPTAGSA